MASSHPISFSTAQQPSSTARDDDSDLETGSGTGIRLYTASPRSSGSDSEPSSDSKWRLLKHPQSLFSRKLRPQRTGKRKTRALLKTLIFVLIFASIAASIVTAVWVTILARLLEHFAPLPTNNGLSFLVDRWHEPTSTSPPLPFWPEGFSRDIRPVACHSHNDYWRAVPLLEALAAGCSSVEADIWLEDTGDDAGAEPRLLVGHAEDALSETRTLASLYIDPLTLILDRLNAERDRSPPVVTGNDDNDDEASGRKVPRGVFDTSPNTTLVLLIDFKSPGPTLWDPLMAALAPLRDRDYLTYWTPSSSSSSDEGTLHPRPLTIVATGDAPFTTVASPTSHRDIFYDAPLTALPTLTSATDDVYNATNSYYASASFNDALPGGGSVVGGPRDEQTSAIESQIGAARERGLKARYWDTPGWPVGDRVAVWRWLWERGVDVLSVDEVGEAARWRWEFCVVEGVALC